MSAGSVRAFAAVELSEPTRATLGDEIMRFSRLDADVKWVRPENIHLTLKFLGDIERKAVADALTALAAAADGFAPVRAEVSGLFLFPSAARPRVVSTGVDAAAASSLERLARRVDEETLARGFCRADKPFKAHITLGRVKSPRGMRALADALLTSDGAAFGEDDIRELTLFMSELSREGPTYTVLGRVPLGG